MSSESVIWKSSAHFIWLQTVAKLSSFVLNQSLLFGGHLQPAMFGIVSLKLELFYSLLLFFVTQPVRLTLARLLSVPRSSDARSLIVDLAWFHLAGICALVSTLVLSANFYFSHDIRHLAAYLFAATIEACAEPFLYFCSAKSVRLRPNIELLAVVVKSTSLYVLVVFFAHDPLDAYSCSQLLYSVCFTLGFMIACRFTTTTVPFPIPRRVSTNTAKILPEWNAVFYPLLSQYVVKLILSEGDKFLFSAMLSPHDQGVYSLVSNYGSLVVRIVFFPVEESIRTYSSTLKTPEQVTALTRRCFKLHLHFGLLMATFGTLYASLFISILARSNAAWSSSSHVLALYCLYLPVLGINGISEAFAFVLAPTFKISTMTHMMVCFTALYFSFSALFVWLTGDGCSGVLLANILTMMIRSTYALWFLMTSCDLFSRNKGLLDITELFQTPRARVVSWCVCVYAGLYSLKDKVDDLSFFGVGCVAGAISVALMIWSDDEYRQFVLAKIRRRSTETTLETKRNVECPARTYRKRHPKT